MICLSPDVSDSEAMALVEMIWNSDVSDSEAMALVEMIMEVPDSEAMTLVEVIMELRSRSRELRGELRETSGTAHFKTAILAGITKSVRMGSS